MRVVLLGSVVIACAQAVAPDAAAAADMRSSFAQRDQPLAPLPAPRVRPPVFPTPQPRAQPQPQPRFEFAVPQKPADMAAKPRVVCGMTLVPGDPAIDPKFGVARRPADRTKFTIRIVEPPICK